MSQKDRNPPTILWKPQITQECLCCHMLLHFLFW